MYIQQLSSHFRHTMLAASVIAAMAQPVAAQSRTLYADAPPAVRCADGVASGKSATIALLHTCEDAMNATTSQRSVRAASMVNTGIVLMRRGETSDALALFNRASSLHDDLPGLSLNIAAAQLRAGANEDALATLEDIEALPDHLQHVAYFNRGLAHWRLDQVYEAYADFKTAQAIMPGYAPARNALAHFTVAPEYQAASVND
ncbi:hypothetical protein [Henriciella mobilis]|nr:hypothetical protein [Henriciella mobilis]